jgi:hypothetical protein
MRGAPAARARRVGRAADTLDSAWGRCDPCSVESIEFKRLFTPRQAESALPLVRQIVADILQKAGRIRELDENDDEQARLQAEMEEHLLELESMGCFFKDWNFSIGLVDFPAVIDGETVFLCWRSDEDELAWYHPVQEGYQGRRRLPKASPVE